MAPRMQFESTFTQSVSMSTNNLGVSHSRIMPLATATRKSYAEDIRRPSAKAVAEEKQKEDDNGYSDEAMGFGLFDSDSSAGSPPAIQHPGPWATSYSSSSSMGRSALMSSGGRGGFRGGRLLSSDTRDFDKRPDKRPRMSYNGQSNEGVEKVIDWSTKSAAEKVLGLIELQEFDGSWSQENADISKILGFTIPASTTDHKVWVTMLAVRYLELKRTAKKGTWDMVVEKARDWLAVNADGLEELEASATKVIEAN